MSDRGEIRVGTAPPPRRGWAVPVVAAILAAVGGLLLLGSFSGSGTALEETTVPELGPEPQEQAVAVVEEFALAWNGADAEAVAEAIGADRPGSLVVPGLMYPRFGPPLERTQLAEALEFLTAVAGLSLGPCEAETAPADLGTATVVRCPDARFEGAYPQALRSGGAPGTVENDGGEPRGMRFVVRADQIVELVASGPDQSPVAYCIWAEAARPASAATLFDLYCNPKTGAAAGEAHAEAAAAFIAAGAPQPSRQTVHSRLAATFVDRFFDLHNAGRPLRGLPWLSVDVAADDLPGFAGGDPPNLQEFLLWTSRLLRVDLGHCVVDPGVPATVVTCPALTVAGPMLGAPHPQPTRFTLLGSMTRRMWFQPFGVILAVEPLGGQPLPLQEVCRGLQQSNAAAAALAFDDDCAPIYSFQAAAALAAASERPG